MAFDPDEQLSIIPTVAELSNQMIETFKQWSDDEWNQDSQCAGWTRAGVVAHITTGTDYRAGVLELGLAGRPIFPWGASSLDDVKHIRAQAVDRLCNGGPSVLIQGFTDAVNRHQGILQNMQREDLAKPARYPRGLVPLGEWIGMQLIELIVHDWDMRYPDDPSARLADIAVEPVLNLLPESQLRFLVHRLADHPELGLTDGEYQICAGSQSWAFRVDDRQVSYVAMPSQRVKQCFTTEPETLILLTLGRFDLESQLQSGTCQFEVMLEDGPSIYTILFSPYISASVIPPTGS